MIRPHALRFGCVAAVLGAGVCVLLAQSEAPTEQGDGDVGQMLLDRSPVPVTEPRQPARQKGPQRQLPVDGSKLVDRPCRLEPEPETGWFILRFAGSDKSSRPVPRRVLPCELLEQMQRVIADEPQARFRISGQNTVFTGHCFLLPWKATVIGSQSSSPQAAARPDSPVNQPADQPQSAPREQVTAEDVLTELMSEDPGRPVARPAVRAEQRRVVNVSVAPTERRVIRPPEAEVVMDRTVRIMPERKGGWLVARFVSDNTLEEPPVRLLPCAKLEQADTMKIGDDGQPAKLRISGQITWYRGRRYLLLQSVMPHRDMGQL